MKKTLMPNLKTANLFRQLSMLMHAGVALSEGCYLLAEGEGNKDTRLLLQQVAGELEQGQSLASSLRSSGLFPAYVTGLLETGERTGRTEETLIAIAEYYEQQHARQRYLRSAVTYPVLLLMFMLVVIAVLLTKVLPVFDDIYASLGGSLTGVAGGLLAVGQWLGGVMPVLVQILVVVAVVAVVCLSIAPLRSAIYRAYQRVFGDRGVSRMINDARFAQAFAMGMASGLNLDDCFPLAASLLSDIPGAVKRSEECRMLLEKGKSLADAMKESGMLPAASCQMLLIGIRAGAGDTAMSQIANQLSDEANEAVHARVSRVEPALVLITSIMVGAILLSVMLPLMNIMKAIG